MKKLLLAGLALALSGCGGMQYVNKTYGNVPVEDVAANNSQYRIFHRADIKKIMVTPSIGNAALSGLTFYGYDPTRGDGMKVACESYLNSKGMKDCTVVRGEEVISGQVEFNYSCEPVTLGTQPAAATIKK